MKRNELIELREFVYKEKNRRIKINKLIEDELIKEYFRLKGIEEVPLDTETREVLKHILDSFRVTKTSGIYVCTSAYYIDSRITDQDTDYYMADVEIDSKYAERKTYVDIESKEQVRASVDNSYGFPLIDDFERDHLILNPYNNNKNSNGFDEVRLDFFENALEHGQTKSKRLILSKYPLLKSQK